MPHTPHRHRDVHMPRRHRDVTHAAHAAPPQGRYTLPDGEWAVGGWMGGCGQEGTLDLWPLLLEKALAKLYGSYESQAPQLLMYCRGMLLYL